MKGGCEHGNRVLKPEISFTLDSRLRGNPGVRETDVQGFIHTSVIVIVGSLRRRVRGKPAGGHGFWRLLTRTLAEKSLEDAGQEHEPQIKTRSDRVGGVMGGNPHPESKKGTETVHRQRLFYSWKTRRASKQSSSASWKAVIISLTRSDARRVALINSSEAGSASYSACSSIRSRSSGGINGAFSRSWRASAASYSVRASSSYLSLLALSLVRMSTSHSSFAAFKAKERFAPPRASRLHGPASRPALVLGRRSPPPAR